MQLLINEVAKIKPPSPKRFGGFLLPIFQESNFRNKQSVVQYLRSYQWVSWIIEKEQNTNHTKVSQTCISKNNEYYGAVTPQIRQAGNRLSGLPETNYYASLLA